jgi:hypothetical protein
VLSSFYFAWKTGSQADRWRKAALAICSAIAVVWLAMISEEDTCFTASWRWTILKIWGATIFAFSIVSCLGNYKRSRHFLCHALVSAALLQFAWMLIQNWGSGSFLKALPPCVSLGILGASIRAPPEFWRSQRISPAESAALGEELSVYPAPNSTTLSTTTEQSTNLTTSAAELQDQPDQHSSLAEVEGNPHNDVSGTEHGIDSPPCPPG